MQVIKRATLHNPLLLGGTNLHMSLDTAKKPELKMVKDGDSLFIFYKKEFVEIPLPSVAQIFPADDTELRAMFEKAYGNLKLELGSITVVPAKPAPIRGKVKAQVSGPHDHVFKGEGAGKTNDKQ